MKLIGITGGIASGKSAVTDYLRGKGCYVICADEVSREVVKKGGAGYRAVKDAFGDSFFMPEGELDRRKLGAHVFSNPPEREKLNRILHPVILTTIMSEAKDSGCDIVFIDAPLLIETGMQNEMDAVWLVTAGEETRLKRIMERDGLSPEEARSRIKSQLPDEEKKKYADAVIDNSGALQNTMEQVQALIDQIKGG
jgi:dephospho-CoA kinase